MTVRADDVQAQFGGEQVFLVLRRAVHTEGARGRRAGRRVGLVVGATDMQWPVSRADAAPCLAIRTGCNRVVVG
ncbi:MAG: hypothetical protein ACLQHS_02125 [Candidatus Limnocylindrales bacterium]